jgi:hypothetical protein
MRSWAHFVFFLAAASTALCTTVRADGPGSEGKYDFFESKVRPLLGACYLCHSANAAQGELRLDSWEGISRGGSSKQPAVVPGDPEHSPLLTVLREAQKVSGPSIHHAPAGAVDDLEEWIRSGAPYPPPRPQSMPPPSPKINAAARQFWSFVPPTDPVVPQVDQSEWSTNPIDRFVYAKLKEQHLSPVGLAEKRTLIRRATLDLIGLPPTPQEVEAFLADNSPQAFAKVVDRLLASPRYGEEWGRHWLDIARYADTAGESADYPIPQAYLYRNWVVASFNRDEPYDQFVREQIAGDLLPAKDEQDRHDKIIATGFIALSRRFSVNPLREMHLTIDDTIDTMGRGMLGLTVGCARCHDHKFDPIPSRDYYALYGIFSSTQYPFPGSEEIQRQSDLMPLAATPQDEAAAADKLQQVDAARAEIRRLKALKTTTQDPDQIKQIDQQMDAQKAIVHQSAGAALAYAVHDTADPHDARIMVRGDPFSLGPEVPRGFLEILGGQTVGANAHDSGRLELAQWITDPHNPLTARVMVNRLWQYHFGSGIVATSSDFGSRGARPTHPELLDWLALQFIGNGWSVKSIHRMIMLSRAYQLAPDENEADETADPGNEYLWHYHRHRLEAESVRDAMLFDSGNLDLSQPGPHPFPPASDWHFTQHHQFQAVYPSNHRSIYLMQQRIKRHPFFALFDGADPNATTGQRLESATPLQALWLLNDPFVAGQSNALAVKLIAADPTPRGQIAAAYQIVLCRPAASDELTAAQAYVDQYASQLKNTPQANHRAALASFVQAVFSSNEFMFVE